MLVNLFHIGPQKSATTWFYEAIKLHPEVLTSPRDSVHYFEIQYHRGDDWFHSHFEGPERPIVLDPTPAYIRAPSTAERIHRYNPDAKIIFCARSPLDRAFSHYWHEKKKDKIKFTFDEALKNIDLFDSWIAPGFYARHYRTYAKLFGEDKVKILFFDDISDKPEKVMNDVCDYLGIAPYPEPERLSAKVNFATNYKSQSRRRIDSVIGHVKIARKLMQSVDKRLVGDNKEYLADVPEATRREIIDVITPDVREFEKITGRDLSAWLEP